MHPHFPLNNTGIVSVVGAVGDDTVADKVGWLYSKVVPKHCLQH